MIYTIKSDLLTVKVNDYGAELVSVVGADGYEYLWDAEKHWFHHAPVLFPACGRIVNDTYTLGGKEYHMGIHGFAPKSEFKLLEKTDSSLTIYIEATDETRAAYPFEFRFTACFEVSENTLNVTFTVQNKSNSVMPYMVGWHPGFTLDHECGAKIPDYSLKFNTDKELISYPITPACFVSHEGVVHPAKNGTYYLDEKEIYDNDSVLFSGTGERCIMSAVGEKHSLDFSWSENLPYFCIWKAPTSEAMFVCLEPWSDLPGDGREENFDDKEMSCLAPGCSEAYRYTAKFNS